MPFLDIEGIPKGAAVAQLKTIKFSELLDRSESEMENLISACEHYGFFYLDLTSNEAGNMMQDLKDLRILMKDWFKQPVSTKMKTPTISNAHGYKPIGVQSGISENTKDGWEALKIGHCELKGRWGLPPVVTSHQRIFDDFSAASHYILKNLLDCISSGLGLKDEESLHNYHRDDEPSKSTLYFLHYPAATISQAGVGQNMHTDIGSLTLLFAPQWGLQALSPDSGDWEWVEPKPGHAIINVGDTLRFLSGRRLRSALHRAVQIEGVDRSSISYFLRASDRTEFRDSDDVKTDAKKWYLRKYETYKQSHEVQRTETVLTGGMMDELVVAP
ncbi:hypothetical protein COCC4DRAFT_148663 [Bipolaris maydis ATCC 48331]|uniref:Fe2OG dioxygenase domain-containing protein n=2 Tax=Cochliobolus heterostrophus TaxID=5016 RepID=M2U7N1_COCH5|nr:uncharacterized protein COCC4DRAFT_148663 [Bipolaris maydis ATCC 48331]EMD94524.1 hypothetical protein COCHEDRAFT_1093897 [Bipolaris maydis C5]KAH7563720.1 hypothetical protein BM1_00767 [Bipolaris maydis]ENI01132.1 hypothetical protein COCC4DRAFT_148663 [Bipolaris maydis ATCC 48331]KAJ5026345.1 hypothetical protein J3E73DRAFT_256750 [Bipolaris maydis]KAJ5059937.1 hypothetical protein J3E74DRAFT_216904 [Bipolaris maydis]